MHTRAFLCPPKPSENVPVIMALREDVGENFSMLEIMLRVALLMQIVAIVRSRENDLTVNN